MCARSVARKFSSELRGADELELFDFGWVVEYDSVKQELSERKEFVGREIVRGIVDGVSDRRRIGLTSSKRENTTPSVVAFRCGGLELRNEIYVL